MKYLKKFNESIVDNELGFIEEEFIYLSDIFDDSDLDYCHSFEIVDNIRMYTKLSLNFTLRKEDFGEIENVINKVKSLPSSDKFIFRFGNEYTRRTSDFNEWKRMILDPRNDDFFGIPVIGEVAWITLSIKIHL